MEVLVSVISCLLFFVSVGGEELHPIEAKPNQCFKIHNSNQPHFYQNPRRPEYDNIFESCTNWLGENKNCLGVRTQIGEILVIYCRDDQKRRRPGCYKIVNKDKREEIICQKLDKQSGCEIIRTRTNLTIVVYCYPRTGAFATVAVKKKSKRTSIFLPKK